MRNLEVQNGGSCEPKTGKKLQGKTLRKGGIVCSGRSSGIGAYAK